MILYYTILGFFIYLLISHFIGIKEGIDETTQSQFAPPDLNSDPAVLSKMNAANINYLKTQIDEVTRIVNENSVNIKQFGKEMTDRMIDMSGQVAVAADCTVSPTNTCSRMMD